MPENLQVNLDHFIVQVEGNIVSDMDGETVMLSIKNGKYYNLGAVGGVIWNSIETPITLKDLLAKIQEEYDVTEQQCLKDIIPFIEQLKKEELIISY